MCWFTYYESLFFVTGCRFILLMLLLTLHIYKYKNKNKNVNLLDVFNINDIIEEEVFLEEIYFCISQELPTLQNQAVPNTF